MPDGGTLTLAPRITLTAWKPMRKGSLRGFATVEFSHMTLFEVPVLSSSGKHWAALPSKPVVDAEGRHVVKEGKRCYTPVLQWKSRDISDRFSSAVVGLVEQHYPGALD
jgi:hypothetical protein